MRECSSRHTMYYVSCVKCQVPGVTCHLSPVTSHMFFFIKKTKKQHYIYPSEKIGQSGGASRWRLCYQRGLPCLVLDSISENVLTFDDTLRFDLSL